MIELFFIFSALLLFVTYFFQRQLSKLREEVQTTKNEIIDLRNYFSKSIENVHNSIHSNNENKNDPFTVHMTVGEVLAKHPSAKDILNTFNLGACSSCSITDEHKFEDVIKEYDINGKMILDALNGLLDTQNPNYSFMKD